MEDQRYIEIPGNETHELPPLFLHPMEEHAAPRESAVDLALVMSEAEEMLAARDEEQELMEQRKFELALQLAEQYKNLVTHWFWGDGILEWIRQCETTFEHQRTLRELLHPDVWPHASRSSFVTLLADKGVDSSNELVRAVGLRLTFRQPPPIDCFSNQFLFYLNSKVADTAYHTWSHLVPQAMAFPPERFHFEVLNLGN